jgi:hypothetical protein
MNRSRIFCSLLFALAGTSACVGRVRVVSGPVGQPSYISAERAIAICQDAVDRQIVGRYDARDVRFRTLRVDDRPGRNDYVIGDALGRRRGREEDFRFVCRVDLRSGRVRSADVRRR